MARSFFDWVFSRTNHTLARVKTAPFGAVSLLKHFFAGIQWFISKCGAFSPTQTTEEPAKVGDLGQNA